MKKEDRLGRITWLDLLIGDKTANNPLQMVQGLVWFSKYWFYCVNKFDYVLMSNFMHFFAMHFCPFKVRCESIYYAVFEVHKESIYTFSKLTGILCLS